MVYDILLGDGDAVLNVGQLISDLGGGITDINLDNSSSLSVTTITTARRYGQPYFDSTVPNRQFTISYKFFGVTHEKAIEIRRKLGVVVSKSRYGTKMTLNGDRNVYYNNVVATTVPTVTHEAGTLTATGQMTFVCYDRYATSTYSKVVKTGVDSENGKIEYNAENNVTTLTLNNEGNMDAWPKITIKPKKDAGYFALASRTALVQAGIAGGTERGFEQYSGGTYAKTILDIKHGDEKGWEIFKMDPSTSSSPLTTNVLIDPYGRLTYQHKPLPGYPDIKGFGWKGDRHPSWTTEKWQGAAYKFDIPEGDHATNWRIDFNMKIWESTLRQVGFFEIIVTDSSDIPIAAYDFAKNTKEWNADVAAKFWYGSGTYKKRIMFGANLAESNQALPNTAHNLKAGDAAFMKEGSKITFYYAGQPTTFTATELEDAQAARIWLVAGTYPHGASGGDITIMLLDSIKFINLNARRYDMIENQFTGGDSIHFDSETADLYISKGNTGVRGALSNAMLARGSTGYPILEPGENKIVITTNDFHNEAPDVEVEWREHWL